MTPSSQSSAEPVAVVLCADDYALTPGVSRGILALLEAGRLSATGAMTNMPGWPEAARALAAHSGRADLGVHLNLTCGAPLGAMPRLAPGGGFPGLGAVARAVWLDGAARAELAAEFARQFDAFEAAMGRPPDFVDGHQHVHALPGVRGALIAEVARRYPAGSVYLRDPADRIGAILARGVEMTKALVVAGLAAGFGRQARAAGFPTNAGFSGFSAFDPARDYAADFRRFLLHLGPCPIVMCHPGEADAGLAGLDPVVATRPLECAFLAGRDSAGLVRPRRFRDLQPGPAAAAVR